MNTKPAHTIPSRGHLTLPEPDPDNITVLTHNLPNKPILPWSHYDSPWHDPEAEDTDQEPENIQQSEAAQEADDSDEHQLVDVAEQQPQTPTPELHLLNTTNPSG